MTSLGVIDKDRANPQLSNSTAEDDPGKYAPNDSISKQQGIDKGTKNYSIDHIIAGTNPNVLADKIKYARDGLETTHIKIGTEEEAIFDKDKFNTSLEFTSCEDAKEIKMEDLSKLVKDACIDLIGLDSPKDDTPFIIEDDEDEEVHTEEVHVEQHTETEDSSVPKPLSPKTIRIQELSTQLLLLQSQNASLPKELNELPSKFSEINGEIKDLKRYVDDLEIEILVSSIAAQLSKLKTLDALPSLLYKVTNALEA
ncbi:hypothetical protein Tco_1502243 [Tanacetum coccineum]